MPSHDIVDGKTAARLEDSEDLGIEPRPIADVHRDMLSPTDVEAFVLKGESEGVGAAIVDFAREFGPIGQERCGFNKGRTEINAGHPAAEIRRKVARWPAESRADVDHRFVGLNIDCFGQLYCGGETACVKLIERRELDG